MRVSLLFATVTAVIADLGIWPQPRSVDFSGPPSQLRPGFVLDTHLTSDVLQHGHARVKASFMATATTQATGFDRVKVTVDSEDEHLGSTTDYSYSLNVSRDGIVVHGASVYGAMYGLQSLSQIVSESGELPHESIAIHDSPDWPWRGVLIDAGRRFFPVPLVKNILDTMSAVKLNVLHLHASDNCRFAVESKVVPNLTGALAGDYAGHYTQQDIKSLIDYAKSRGIRVVPEFDVPGHARGWLPAQSAGVQFCTDGPYYSQLYPDPENKTLDAVTAVFREMAQLFTDEVIHIGADETFVKGKCSKPLTYAFEKEIVAAVERLGKTVSGWEELYFRAHVGSQQGIVNAWAHQKAKDATATGRRVVENSFKNFYLQQGAAAGPKGWAKQWYNIASGVPESEKSLVLGGEVSMWTDTYCPLANCGANEGGPRSAAAMFPPSRDQEFSRSVGGLLWPRGFVAAQAFWHFDPALSPQSADFEANIWAINDKVAAQGGYVCPSKCQCGALAACGKPYISNSTSPMLV